MEALEVMVMEKRKQELGDDHPDTLTSMAILANTYRHQSRWKDAEALNLMVSQKRKLVLGDDHPDTLTSMGNLADMYRNQGRWKEAEALQVVVMEKRKQVLERTILTPCGAWGILPKHIVTRAAQMRKRCLRRR